jgi:hypothetical protein
MACFDVFNGDADGLCALQQLRLADPREATLVTGVKRDIALLERVDAFAGDEVTVLDISLDKNRDALRGLLDRGAKVAYFDHHYAGDIPDHPRLDAHIDTRPDRGTSLLVDDQLDGRFRAWAVVGTFGDNFDATARKTAGPLDLGADALDRLRELGILLNYNGYGAAVADLHLPPDELYRRIAPYPDPLDFMACDETFELLRNGYAEDMAQARAAKPVLDTSGHLVVVLPAAPWARRVSGPYANELAQSDPRRANALLTELETGDYLVSVRAPLSRPNGADALCRQFETGGGRKAAAGINRLPSDQLDWFIAAFQAAFR